MGETRIVGHLRKTPEESALLRKLEKYRDGATCAGGHGKLHTLLTGPWGKRWRTRQGEGRLDSLGRKRLRPKTLGGRERNTNFKGRPSTLGNLECNTHVQGQVCAQKRREWALHLYLWLTFGLHAGKR